MRFEPESKHGANNGLNIARDHMETIKAKFPWISYGDLWTLAGIASIAELGGPMVRSSASRLRPASSALILTPFVALLGSLATWKNCAYHSILLFRTDALTDLHDLAPQDGYDYHATPDGRLPDATQQQDHLRKIFYRMGFVSSTVRIPRLTVC